MEVLSDILRSMRVEGSVYFCDLLDAPWVKEFTDTESAGFHLVRRGGCRVIVGGETEYLGPGDLIFLSAGVDHQLSSYAVGEDQDRRPSCTMLLCGYCNFEMDTLNPNLSLFPRMTIIRNEELIKHSWLKATLDQLGSEYLSQSPGSELVVNKLTEVVLIEFVRINFGRENQESFLLALNDKAISKALNHLHENPEFPWTIVLLADKVALSRAAFARRFKNLVGIGVFQYLTELRMQKAKEMLRETAMSVDDIASRVGYESDLSFVKVFKKHSEKTPKQYRASHAGNK